MPVFPLQWGKLNLLKVLQYILCLCWKWSTSLFVQQPWKVAAFAGGAEKEAVAAEASAVVILAPSARLLTEVTRTS